MIIHAESHYRKGDDYDRRLALISYDNSIEISVTAYLSLNPIQRNGREYARTEVDKWMQNFHSKIDFVFEEVKRRGDSEQVGKGEILWYHGHRNEHYHGANRGVPEQRTLDEIREAALWVFSMLFEVPNVEAELESAIRERDHSTAAERSDSLDTLIDEEFGIIRIAGRRYYTSEILYSIDPDLYLELSSDLTVTESDTQMGDEVGDTP